MTTLNILGIGVAAPGLLNWPQARAVLRGEAAYDANTRPTLKPELLPATERRRSTEVINLALHVGAEALAHTGAEARDIRTVFASSGGDAMILHRICETLATPERMVSPTQFHNSVHNAAAGYWHIGTRSHAASTALSSYDDSFASGLLESVAWLHDDPAPVLLVAYDVPAPPPLLAARPLAASFGVALLLGLDSNSDAAAKLALDLLPTSEPATTMSDPALESLRRGNPAARALPLLRACSGNSATTIALPYLDHAHLRVTVTPCPR